MLDTFFNAFLSIFTWFNRSGGPAITGHIRKVQCWNYGSLGWRPLSAKAAILKNQQELLGISHHGVFCSLRLNDYIWGTFDLKGIILLDWLQEVLYNYAHSFLCIILKCGFSNPEMWCYLQPRKVLFDSSGNPLWTSPDYNFDFAL